MRRYVCLGLLVFGSLLSLRAQHLQPGFDKAEYLEMLRLNARLADDSIFWAGISRPKQYRRWYRSPIVGFDNRWELWQSPGGTAVVAVRGTTLQAESWLANFYAAMLPAKGELRLSPERTFRYDLAPNPKAAVHAGWLLSTAALSDDVVAKLDSCYRRGTRDVIVTGHSQGGAVAFLLSAYLRSLQQQGRLPADLRLKTYCSAAPKPGNLQFAYDYEARTHAAQGSWSFNVVNSADWVPETPVTIQKMEDFNVTNPFVGTPTILGKRPFFERLALGYAFGRLRQTPRKAHRVYQRYLGKMLEGRVRKYLPGYQPGPYAPTSQYTRIGPTVVLLADPAYLQRYPDNPQQIFTHHFFQPYVYLTERLP